VETPNTQDTLLAPFGERTRALFRTVGYTPTPPQQAVLLSPATLIAVTGGIQVGKSTIGAKKVLKEFIPDLKKAIARADAQRLPLTDVLPIIYWLVGSDYDATEREFHYLQNDFQALGLLKRQVKKINPGMLEIMGGSGRQLVLAQIKTKSAKDFRTLRKEAPSGIVICEAGQLDLAGFERCMERTAPGGAWLMATGTIETSWGWFTVLGKAWGNAGPDKAWFRLKSASNYYMFPGGDDDPKLVRIRGEMTDTQYKERYEGEPCLPTGVVFPEFRPDFHVGNVAYEPGLQVQLWEDPGYGTESAHAVEVVQIVEGQVRIVDEIYERGRTTEEIIKDIVRHREWYKDFEVLVDDPHYATQHHSTTSSREIWRKFTGKEARNPRVRLLPRIERIKTFLVPSAGGAPKPVISPKCRGLLSEFGMMPNPFDHQEHIYRWRTDSSGNQIGDEPEPKWDHGIQALGRGLVHNFSHALGASPRKRPRAQFFGRREGGKRKRGTRGGE